MICRTCLRRAATALPQRGGILAPTKRQFSITLRAREPATTSDSAAAPSTPGGVPAAARPLSSCPAGTPLNGLNYFKNKTDPVALPDEEYPAWLWSCLEVKKKAAGESGDLEGDLFSKSKKQRRIALKRQRELEARMLAAGDLSALEPKIPLSQQSINLPGAADGGVEAAVRAADAREDLRVAMRKERKAKIKETNYLKNM